MRIAMRAGGVCVGCAILLAATAAGVLRARRARRTAEQDGEPEARRLVPLGGGWQFDPDDPRGPSLGRKDGKYFLVRMQEMRDRNGRPYSQPVLVQEPQIAVQPGAPRVVGQILVARNRNGRLRAAWDRGLDGTEFHHLPMSSISNPDRVGTPARSRRTRYVCLDPKRIDGYVRVDLVEEDFPDAEGVTLADLAETSDGRTLAALAAVCL